MSLGDLVAFFWATYPDADKTIYGSFFKTLQDNPVSLDVAESVLRKIQARKEALKLSEAAFKASQDPTQLDELKTRWEAFNALQADVPVTEDTFVSEDLLELLESTYAEPGVRWRLDCLNKSLGSLRPGDFGFIFARPETGKTTFLTSEATNFSVQASRPTLWIKYSPLKIA